MPLVNIKVRQSSLLPTIVKPYIIPFKLDLSNIRHNVDSPIYLKYIGASRDIPLEFHPSSATITLKRPHHEPQEHSTTIYFYSAIPPTPVKRIRTNYFSDIYMGTTSTQHTIEGFITLDHHHPSTSIRIFNTLNLLFFIDTEHM